MDEESYVVIDVIVGVVVYVMCIRGHAFPGLFI